MSSDREAFASIPRGRGHQFMHEHHIKWNEIIEFAEDAGATAPAVRAHMAACAPCRRAAENARRLLALFDDSRLPAPPPALVEMTVARILGQAAEHRPAWLDQFARRLGRSFTEIRAALVADSLAPNAALRGSATLAAPRTLRYETDDFAITVAIEAGSEDGQWDLMGQVMPRREPALPANAWAAVSREGDMLEVELSEVGEFQFTKVTASSEELSLLLGDSWIRLRLPLG